MSKIKLYKLFKKLIKELTKLSRKKSGVKTISISKKALIYINYLINSDIFGFQFEFLFR